MANHLILGQMALTYETAAIRRSKRGRKCVQCGGPISVDLQASAIYCGIPCQQIAAALRRLPHRPTDYPLPLLWKDVLAEEKLQLVLQPLMRVAGAKGVEAKSLIECSTGKALKQTDFERWTERGVETSIFPLTI